jgi:hypothetical protein
MMTRDTNSGPAIPGDRIRLGGRRRTTPNCRDEVLVALDALVERHRDRPFAVREVYAEMVTKGTTYAELSVFKTMQGMKASDLRLPLVQLERVGRKGFRLIGA